MTAETGTFRVHWQDYRNKRFGEKKPDPAFKDFPSRNEAEDFKRHLRAEGGEDLIATITPVVTKVRINRRSPPSEYLPQYSGGMRLTK